MLRCSCLAAARSASFTPGSMRRLKMAVLLVANVPPCVALVLRKYGNVPESPAQSKLSFPPFFFQGWGSCDQSFLMLLADPMRFLPLGLELRFVPPRPAVSRTGRHGLPAVAYGMWEGCLQPGEDEPGDHQALSLFRGLHQLGQRVLHFKRFDSARTFSQGGCRCPHAWPRLTRLPARVRRALPRARPLTWATRFRYAVGGTREPGLSATRPGRSTVVSSRVASGRFPPA